MKQDFGNGHSFVKLAILCFQHQQIVSKNGLHLLDCQDLFDGTLFYHSNPTKNGNIKNYKKIIIVNIW